MNTKKEINSNNISQVYKTQTHREIVNYKKTSYYCRRDENKQLSTIRIEFVK